MDEEIERAEQRWRKRPLFNKPQRRRLWPWLLLGLIAGAAVLLHPQLIPPLGLS